MRILAFTTTFWHSREDADSKRDGLFGLQACRDRIVTFLRPVEYFLACGTWSEPLWSPLSITVPVINSGVDYTKPYDHWHWQYDACAYMAAMAYALNRRDWDLLVALDNDVLIGDVNFDALLREFMQRPEEFLTPDWHGRPGGPFHAIKRSGAVRWLHMRRRANLIEPAPGDPLPLLIEDELGVIFAGRWWNPWPHLPTMRQDYGLHNPRPEREPLDQRWPFVRCPHPDIVQEFLHNHTAHAKSVVAG